MNVIESSYQYVHMQVTWKRNIPWLVTAVYASPRYVPRLDLWDNLARLADSISDSWVVLGDFNAIMSDHERRGGSSNFSVRGMLRFREMVQNCHLIDVGFQGSPFTWRHGNLLQRLDRVLCNLQWCTNFPSATVFHLPFFKSDHRAMLVQMKKKERPNRRRRPFRFLASWLTHDDFPNVMARSWPRSSQWCRQVRLLQGSLQDWNKKVFGNIFAKKSRLNRRLEIVANRLVAQPSAELEHAQTRLWREYEQVLAQEEILWFQKSRSKWLLHGDKNYRFFHGVTTVRRRKNSFDMLQDSEGNWVGDQERLEGLVTNYFWV